MPCIQNAPDFLSLSADVETYHIYELAGWPAVYR
jgi:hypothetical protein